MRKTKTSLNHKTTMMVTSEQSRPCENPDDFLLDIELKMLGADSEIIEDDSHKAKKQLKK